MIRVVLDTSVLISAIIRPQGAIGGVISHLRDGDYVYVYSMPLIEEFIDVITRPKIFQKYGLNLTDVHTILSLLQWRGEIVYPMEKIEICRDPKDNMILEAAMTGNVDMIITSDADLLILGEVEGIPIVTAAIFLSQLSSPKL